MMEYLVVEDAGATRELRLEKISCQFQPSGNQRHRCGERILITNGQPGCPLRFPFKINTRFSPPLFSDEHLCRRDERVAVKEKRRGITWPGRNVLFLPDFTSSSRPPVTTDERSQHARWS